MSILITGLEMPAKGWQKVIRIFGDGTVVNCYDDFEFGKAVPVPPHGDLIERDKLRETMFIGDQCLYSWDEIEDAIDYAPTIIPASEEGE